MIATSPPRPACTCRSTQLYEVEISPSANHDQCSCCTPLARVLMRRVNARDGCRCQWSRFAGSAQKDSGSAREAARAACWGCGDIERFKISNFLIQSATVLVLLGVILVGGVWGRERGREVEGKWRGSVTGASSVTVYCVAVCRVRVLCCPTRLESRPVEKKGQAGMFCLLLSSHLIIICRACYPRSRFWVPSDWPCVGATAGCRDVTRCSAGLGLAKDSRS